MRRTEGRFLFVHASPRDPIREYVLSTDGILNPEKLRSVFSCFDFEGSYFLLFLLFFGARRLLARVCCCSLLLFG